MCIKTHAVGRGKAEPLMRGAMADRKRKQILNRTIGFIITRIKQWYKMPWRFTLKKRAAKIQNCFITCSGRKDGVGAQVQGIFSTMLFAQEFKLTYIHTPFQHLEHNELGNSWETSWETFFNAGKDEITIDEIKGKSLNVVNIYSPAMSIIFKPNTLYVVKHCHLFADSNANFYSRISDRFIEKYRASSKRTYQSFYETGKINIAIHVRRGDVSKERPSSARYTDNLYYESLLASIKSILYNMEVDVSIHLYSQGIIESFHELKEMDVNYHLDECAFTTFNNLVSADILIMAKSSFSYSAALLSEAIIIYEPFWHKPLDGWIRTKWMDKSKKVMFDELNLKQRINSLLESNVNFK